MSNEIRSWDEELAGYASEEAAVEQVKFGKTFSFKSGVLSYDGVTFPNNEIAVVILNSIFTNLYYDKPWSPDSKDPPVCYAYGLEQNLMVPSSAVVTPQHDKCATCPHNKYESAKIGKGKACGNKKKLAVIPAGVLKDRVFTPYDDPEQFESAEIAQMILPVTSVTTFGSYVTKLASTIRRPTFAVYTKIKVVPDVKTQFAVQFSLLDKIPSSLGQVIMERRAESEAGMESTYEVVKETEGSPFDQPPPKQPKQRKF